MDVTPKQAAGIRAGSGMKFVAGIETCKRKEAEAFGVDFSEKVLVSCCRCGVGVYIGPRQISLLNLDPGVRVLCVLCCANAAGPDLKNSLHALKDE